MSVNAPIKADELKQVNSIAKDSLFSFAGEALAIPSLIVIAGVLGRQLPLESFGQYTIAVTFVVWLQFISTTGLMRIAVQMMSSEKGDWQEVAGNIMSGFLVSGAIFSALGIISAPLLAGLLHVQGLSEYLAVFSLNVFLFSWFNGYRSILAGLGRFRERSTVTAVYWIARLSLTVGFVLIGWQVWGAILGVMSGTLLALAASFCFLRVPIRLQSSSFSKLRPAFPLLIAAIFIQVFEKMDLFVIKALGHSIGDAGIFSAAKNAAGVPGLVALAVAPVLIAAVSKYLSRDDINGAISASRQGLIVALLMLPMGLVVAACSRNLMELVYGSAFVEAVPILAPLFCGGLLLLLQAVVISILTAFRSVRLVVVMSFLTLLANVVAQPFCIMNWGMLGSAYCELTVSGVAAVLAAVALWLSCRVPFPMTTAVRTVAVCGTIYLLGTLSVSSTWWLLRLAGLSLAVPALFLLLREPLLLGWCRQLSTVLVGWTGASQRNSVR